MTNDEPAMDRDALVRIIEATIVDGEDQDEPADFDVQSAADEMLRDHPGIAGDAPGAAEYWAVIEKHRVRPKSSGPQDSPQA